jgi:hypothetical protein
MIPEQGNTTKGTRKRVKKELAEMKRIDAKRILIPALRPA